MELGQKARDLVTGFTGVVTGMVVYISGCNQALLAPSVKEDGTPGGSQWFDLQRLERVGDSQIVLNNSATPGPDAPAPRR